MRIEVRTELINTTLLPKLTHRLYFSKILTFSLLLPPPDLMLTPFGFAPTGRPRLMNGIIPVLHFIKYATFLKNTIYFLKSSLSNHILIRTILSAFILYKFSTHASTIIKSIFDDISKMRYHLYQI